MNELRRIELYYFVLGFLIAYEIANLYQQKITV